MTIEEIRKSDKEFLIPGDIADVFGAHQQTINIQAKQDPDKLGFPVSVMGNRVKIPRLGFLHWWDYGRSVVQVVRESDICKNRTAPVS